MDDVPLITDTHEMLARCRGRWPEVVARANVSHAWLSKFARGVIPNPGVRTLQRVHAVLSEMVVCADADADADADDGTEAAA